MKQNDKILAEARLRWTGLIFEKRVLEVRDEWQQMHADCASSTTVGDILAMYVDPHTPAYIHEQSETVGDILASFDTEAGGIEGDLEKMVDELVKGIMKFADKGQDLKQRPAKQIKKDLKTKVKKETGKDLRNKADMDDDAIAKQEHDKQADELRKALLAIADDLKALQKTFSDAEEKGGGKKAAYKAFKSGHGKAALKKIAALRKLPAAKNAAGGFLGTEAKDQLVKLMQNLVKKFVPYSSTIIDGWKMLKGAKEAGGKIKGIFAKFKKSNAPPEDKFAEYAKSIARGPDKKMGDMAKALQLDDSAEAVIDDRLEIQFIEDYVAKLRDVDPKTPLADVNINDMITKWVKQQGHENIDLEVAA